MGLKRREGRAGSVGRPADELQKPIISTFSRSNALRADPRLIYDPFSAVCSPDLSERLERLLPTSASRRLLASLE